VITADYSESIRVFVALATKVFSLKEQLMAQASAARVFAHFVVLLLSCITFNYITP